MTWVQNAGGLQTPEVGLRPKPRGSAGGCFFGNNHRGSDGRGARVGGVAAWSLVSSGTIQTSASKGCCPLPVAVMWRHDAYRC